MEERQADLERRRDRMLHPDHRLWNYHAAHAQGLRVYASPQLTARWQVEPSAARGAGPSLSELLKLKLDAAAPRVQLAVIKHEVATRTARGLAPLTEADEGWQIILRGLARYQDACRKARLRHAEFEGNLSNIGCKAGFDSAQPRVPAGNPDGGHSN